MLETKEGIYNRVQLDEGDGLSKLLNDLRNSGPLCYTCQSLRNIG